MLHFTVTAEILTRSLASFNFQLAVTHEFIIYAMRQRESESESECDNGESDNFEVSFPCVCPLIDHEFRHNIVTVVSGSTSRSTLTML